MNLAIWLERTARLCPRSEALFVGTRCVADYAGFHATVRAIAGGLCHGHGVLPGDRIALFLPNCTAYLELLYAIWHAGAVAVPINCKLHAKEADWIIGNAGAKLVFGSSDSADRLTSLKQCRDYAVIAVGSDEYATLCQAPELADPVNRDSADLAWLFYTSGTTGKPKGVMLSHGNLAAMALTYFADIDTVGRDNAMIYAAPMSHGAGLYNFMFVMKGARHVVPASGGFDPTELAALLKETGGAVLFAAPTMVRRLVQYGRMNGYDGAGLKTVLYGGGPMYLADILEAIELFGPRFVQIYGQGESPMTITALSKDLIAAKDHPLWQHRLTTVGCAQSSVEIRVVDDDGQECLADCIGEIYVRGPTVMQGYWKNPAASEATLQSGWLATGDMGAMDKDGFLTLHDRSKDVIISGGTNIYPREVEETLLLHPDVEQVSIVGAPHPDWGEQVVAFVVRTEGGKADVAALDAHCMANIARFKRPKHYIFVEDLPKNAYGKVLKTELRDRLEAELGR